MEGVSYKNKTMQLKYILEFVINIALIDLFVFI